MNVLDSIGISNENREQYILIRGGQLAGVAFIVKSSEAKNHLNELNWIVVPETSQGQTETASSSRGNSEAQVLPSDTQEQQTKTNDNNAAEAEKSLSQGNNWSSVLEEDLGLSVTDDKDEEDEDMGDGGQSSTDEDLSGDTDLSLLDRLHMEEAGETVLSETGIFTASLGNGNHRRETLDPFVWEGSIMSQQKVSDSLVTFSKQLMTKSSMTQQPTQKKHKTLDPSSSSIMCDKCPTGTMVSRTYMKRHLKKYHATSDEVTTRSRSSNNNLEEQNIVGLHTPRTSRRTFKEPPVHASTPKPILNSHKYNNLVKCEYCGKRLLKKSMKQHIQKMHIRKLLECRKCGSKFLREAAREIHEETCVINYEV